MTSRNNRLALLAAAPLAALTAFASALAAEPAPALQYAPAADAELDAETKTWIDEFLAGLSPLQGEVEISSANASLDVPDTHYFLGAQDAQAVLEQAWGNPPDDTILGMIFPAGASPLDADIWGATISYLDDGYISDEDAAETDYEKMMVSMKKNANDENAWRTENGYDSIEIVGWAEAPTYNAETNKMYWAKELKFGGSETNTLNYDIRVLGRRGALVISFISSIDQLAAIKATAPTVLEMASFKSGSTYAEFDPSIDKKAAYGVAGLVGGAMIAKKTGLLAAILLFGKKFIVFIIAGLAAAFGAVRKMFGAKG